MQSYQKSKDEVNFLFGVSGGRQNCVDFERFIGNQRKHFFICYIVYISIYKAILLNLKTNRGQHITRTTAAT